MKMLLSGSALTVAAIVGIQVVSHDVAAQAPQRSVSSAESSTATPRLPNGKPDLSGTWVPEGTAATQAAQAARAKTLGDGSLCVFGNCDALPPLTPREHVVRDPTAEPAGGRRTPFPKYKAEFVAKVRELSENQVETDTSLKCQPPGVPRIGPPAKIVQNAKETVFLYNDLNGPFFRVVATDGRPVPKPSQWPTYLGESVGRWEGDTFVVETVNFNEETWLTDNGAFHTKDLRVVERFTRNGDKIDYRVTSYDPAVLAEPWEGRPRMLEISTQEMEEPVRCEDRSTEHVVDGRHHDNVR